MFRESGLKGFRYTETLFVSGMVWLLCSIHTLEWSFLNGVEVKVAVTRGFSGAAHLMEEVRDGKSPYHFVEVMACPGGCITGGGQPRSEDPQARSKRMEALYREDEGKPLRKSHDNPDILLLYEEYLGHPLGRLSHELLHTGYTERSRY